jgi:hypothetical protein
LAKDAAFYEGHYTFDPSRAIFSPLESELREAAYA